jgi:hypothetical protein
MIQNKAADTEIQVALPANLITLTTRSSAATPGAGWVGGGRVFDRALIGHWRGSNEVKPASEGTRWGQAAGWHCVCEPRIQQVPVPLRTCWSCDERFIRFKRLSHTPFPLNPSAPAPPHYSHRSSVICTHPTPPLWIWCRCNKKQTHCGRLLETVRRERDP